MKTYKHKIVTLTLMFLTVISVQAQKFDKTIKEKFKVNSDVEIVINTAYTDVDIETWNKNEVSIEAVIEVEGLPKEEAEKILAKWKFEALGNKNKVKIVSLSNNFGFDFQDIEVQGIDKPDLSGLAGLAGLAVLAELPEMPELPEIMEMPEIDFEVEFDYDAYKKDSTYLKGYKMRVAKQVKRFKESDWKRKYDSVRNSDEYKLKIIEFKKATKEMAKEMKEFKESKEFKRTMEESKRVVEQVRKEMLNNKELMRDQMKVAKEASKKAIEMIKEMKDKVKFSGFQKNGENIYFYNGDNKNSKVKIKKYLKIKVPKNATFDLNVRHGKVTIPESNKKMSANMSYGNFIGGVISGSSNELKFSNSPVEIEILNSSNITLKNVPNATFGIVENANLFANSSDVVIEKVGSNVSLSQKFGNLKVVEIDPNFQNLKLNLEYAKGIFPLDNLTTNYSIETVKSKINSTSKSSDLFKNKFLNILKKNETSIQGDFSTSTKTINIIYLKCNYSTITSI